MFTPHDLIQLARYFFKDSKIALLLSGSDFDSAEHSFLCLFPFEEVTVSCSSLDENPWDVLKRKLHGINQGLDMPEWIGYLTYEMGAYHDETVLIDHFPNHYPDAYFQRFTVVLKLNHNTGKLIQHVNEEGIETLNEQQLAWASIVDDRTLWDVSSTSQEVANIRVSRTLEAIETYSKKIRRAKEHIFAGDIYQVNISQECCYQGRFVALDIFSQLFHKNPAPFSAFLELQNSRYLISSSPERLLSRTGTTLETRPIKGTAPRGFGPELDSLNKEALLSSAKNKAELLMITDLMRNDLGKVSCPGTVTTEKIWHCEGYTNVFHLLSVIKSKVSLDKHSVDIIRSVFPGGSITGCPKIRAMEIITDIEKEPRGIYTGSIGYFSGNGDFDFNIAIRTLDVENDSIKVRLGGAIIAESDPNAEYQETLDKGKSIFECLNEQSPVADPTPRYY